MRAETEWENSLEQSTVHRQLDTKLKVLGMEALDLLLVLLFAGGMNVLFGQTALALYLVFLLPLVLAFGLILSKRGKPDKYLLHLLKFGTTPGFYSAGQVGELETQRQKKIYKELDKEGSQ